ncbi:MAG TPA: hypothetical protein VMU09_08710 [Acidimicrobiales bacterium]|nr:hypothetical protein [Acidimicrobiales bacterium]
MTQGIARYADASSAEADGYAPITERHGATTHYLDRAVVAAGSSSTPDTPRR